MRQAALIRTQQVAIRRRARDEGPRVKASFTLHEQVINAVKTAVAEGHAENASAFVEDAVTEKLRRSRRAALYAAYEEAAQDAVFRADMEATARAFDVAAKDGLGDAH